MYETYDDRVSGQRAGHADFFVGVLAGAALGAAVALLYAPVRGREAREMLGERLHDGMNRANAAIDRGRSLAAHGRDLAEQGRGFVADAREVVTQAIADGRNAYRRVKADA